MFHLTEYFCFWEAVVHTINFNFSKSAFLLALKLHSHGLSLALMQPWEFASPTPCFVVLSLGISQAVARIYS